MIHERFDVEEVFFFQAEDGIRDIGVTGVQTCALPIFAGALTGGYLLKGKSGWCSSICPMLPVQRLYGQTPFVLERNDHRSEERRVGKECRSRWSPDH